MEWVMSTVKMKIDVKSGVIDIESDAETFDVVSKQAAELLDKFSKIELQGGREAVAEANTPTSTAGNEAETDNQSSQRSRTRKRKGSGPAKLANWQIVDELLSEDQMKELRDYYATKSPKKQNDQVAVLIYKLKELTGRDGFDGNEVHTAFQIVDVSTPKNLTAVFGNMATDGLGKSVDKKFTPNFTLDDLVKRKLKKSDDE
jgi:hypothetical protein